jgi:soluble lytic murein transglycosylase-like protein
MKKILLAAAAALSLSHPASAQQAEYSSMVASHAAANGVPVELVHRVIMRESRYNPQAVSKGNYGMMQIRLGTARGLGYTGTAQGLLDPETNLTYAVKYLAGAYRVAGGNQDQAVRYYAAGYYYAAKRQGQVERVAQTSAQPDFFNAFAQQTPVHIHHRYHRHHH